MNQLQTWINWITHDKFKKENFTYQNFKNDLYAGIIVGLIAIPQSLASAQLAGLPPVYGLYASILPVIFAVLFGSSNLISTGPVVVLSILTATIITPLAEPGTAGYITYAIVLAIASGIFQIILGMLRAGWLINFLSHPIIYGFTNAAAIVIVFTQLGNLFGVSVPAEHHFYITVWQTFKAVLEHADPTTTIIAITSIIFILGLKKLSPKIPGSLIAIIIGTAVCWYFNLNIKTIGLIDNPFPRLTIPEFHLNYLYDLFFGVVLISTIGVTETIAVAQSIATKTKQKVNPNHELIGQGLANIASGFSGGYPVSGSISRSALNYSIGAKTWVSSLFCAITVSITIIFFFKVLKYTPQVLLSVIIIFGISSIINLKKFKAIFEISFYDGLAALITFAGTLLLAPDMEKGIIFGLSFSLIYFIYRNSHPHIVFLSRFKDGSLRDNHIYHLKQCQSIVVIRLDGPLFFANAMYFENKVVEYLSHHPDTKHVILAAGAISEIDATGIEVLTGLIESINSAGKTVYIANIKYNAEKMFKHVGLWQTIHPEHFYTNTQIAVKEVLKIANHNKTHIDPKNCPLEKQMNTKEQLKKIMNSQILGKIANKYILKRLKNISE